MLCAQSHGAQAAHAHTPSSQMTVQRRGEYELIEINCVSSAPAAARHQWRSPNSEPHLHVFITLKHGQLSRLSSISVCELPSLPPSNMAGLHYFLLRAKWDLSVWETVDWPVSKLLHALRAVGSLIILCLRFPSFKGGFLLGGLDVMSPIISCRV